MINRSVAAGKDYLIGEHRLKTAHEFQGCRNTIGKNAREADDIRHETFREFDNFLGVLPSSIKVAATPSWRNSSSSIFRPRVWVSPGAHTPSKRILGVKSGRINRPPSSPIN